MTNEIQLDGTQYIHLTERSCYNNNYYMHRETGEIIFEECEELYGTFAFWRWSSTDEIFLGRSEQDITEGLITIHPDWL